MTLGQDESVFHAYILGNKTWYVLNKVGLRKKSNGPGCHVSAFVGYVLGFGLRVPPDIMRDVLSRCNRKRDCETSAVDDNPKVPLKENPAIRLDMRRLSLFVCCRPVRHVYALTHLLHACVCVCRMMMIGVNKDGWWDEIKLMHQSEDVLDFLEAWDTDNEYQFIGRFDQSVAHNKKNASALVRQCTCIRVIHAYIHH